MKLLKQTYKRPFFDLSQENSQFEGIYSPGYRQQEVGKFMTSHYKDLKNAQSQAKSFDLTNFYLGLLSEALKKSNFNQRNQNLKILDIGCGFGSTTIPLLKLFPKAQIIASELSAPMLFVLKQKLTKLDQERTQLFQLNAEELNFYDNSFDLVVGAAILHHLFHPEKTIKDSAKILKPGGMAIFFEPFQEGMNIMALIYQAIIHDGRFRWLNPFTKFYFRRTFSIWQKMINLKKSDSFFSKVDDKWFFKRDFFKKFIKPHHFQDCLIFRVDQSSRPYTQLVKNHFPKTFGAVPKWILEIVNDYEKCFSDEMKDELLIEGCIVLMKRPKINY